LEGVFDRVREVLDRGALRDSPVERLLEEGYNSTDIAAALFELLTGGGAEPADEPEPKPARSEAPDEPARLRPASKGFDWVRLDVGRETRITPRDILGLLEDSLGLPARTVGIIEIQRGQSFAQVPHKFLDVLRDGPRDIETQAGPVRIEHHRKGSVKNS
jgi:ATP-dependent RNA helicase DeaD